MNPFNEEEFRNICGTLGIEAQIKDEILRYESGDYFRQVVDSVQNDRRGEVVFCVVRPNGKIIVTTCSEYPENIFRIPTGGIGHDEDILKAVYREAKEELGLDTEITSFAGVIRIRFEYMNESIMFYSYVFILKETGGELLKDATDDEISEAREVTLEELELIADSLAEVGGKWRDWARFRRITTGAALRYLRNKHM